MIALIGSSGYIGTSFIKEMRKQNIEYVCIKHSDIVIGFSFPAKTELVINCAGFIPLPSVSLCEKHPAESIRGNVLLPQLINFICEKKKIPFGHISTGCLWGDSNEHQENDEIQRSFTGYCGFYVGTKVLSEEAIRQYDRHYLWRVRLPFDEYDCPKNYLSKLASFNEVFDHENTISHRSDFARACLELWRIKAPFGTYNVMNPGSIKASEIIQVMLENGIRKTAPKFLKNMPGECRVNVNKLLSTGVEIRTIHAAFDDAINNWKVYNV